MNVRHSKRSWLAAAAVGALILGTSTAGFAQSADSSASTSATTQDAKMAAVLDSLKTAGVKQATFDNEISVGQAQQRAAIATGQALAAAAAANTSTNMPANTPSIGADGSVAAPVAEQNAAVTTSLKAAGLQQANFNNEIAMGQAQQRAAIATGQALAQAQAQDPQAPQGPGVATGNMQATVDALKAAGLQQATFNNEIAMGQAQQRAAIATGQALSQAQAQDPQAPQAPGAPQSENVATGNLRSTVDALKAAGLAQATQQEVQAAQEAQQRALMAQAEAQAEAQAQDPQAPGASLGQGVATGNLGSTVDALKAAGLAQATQNEVQSAQEAQQRARDAQGAAGNGGQSAPRN